MNCKGICIQYKASRSLRVGHYETGHKRCHECEIFIKWEGGWCPCCGCKLRERPKNSKYRIKLLEKRLQEKN